MQYRTTSSPNLGPLYVENGSLLTLGENGDVLGKVKRVTVVENVTLHYEMIVQQIKYRLMVMKKVVEAY